MNLFHYCSRIYWILHTAVYYSLKHQVRREMARNPFKEGIQGWLDITIRNQNKIDRIASLEKWPCFVQFFSKVRHFKIAKWIGTYIYTNEVNTVFSCHNWTIFYVCPKIFINCTIFAKFVSNFSSREFIRTLFTFEECKLSQHNAKKCF